MKNFLICAAAALIAVFSPLAQTARLTSDASQAAPPPLPPGIYQPPLPSIAIIWHTNRECLVERVTVSSNVVPVWRWLDHGVVYTNYATPIASNVISVTTNEVRQ